MPERKHVCLDSRDREYEARTPRSPTYLSRELPAARLPAVEPVRVSGAGALSSVTGADGWVAIPESREDIPVGETVTVKQWGEAL